MAIDFNSAPRLGGARPKMAPPSLTQGEAEARAMAELQRRGIGVDASLVVADGRLRRYRTSADGSMDTAGWLVVHAGEWPCLLYGDWRQDGEKAGQQKVNLWDHADRPLTLEERRSMDAAMESRRQTREAEKRREQDEAAERARTDLAKAGPADPDHPYLQRKRVDPAPGLRQARIRHPKRPKDAPLEDALLVPLTNAQGHLRGYQRIYADGYKANQPGAEKLGTFFELPGQGPNSAFLVVCEGYATAASISRAADGATVLSVCDRGNIRPVLEGLKAAGRLDPDRTLIVADNDWETARKGYLEAKAKGTLGTRTVSDFNPGATAARRAAEAFGCRWTLAVPDEAIYRTGEACTDANDLYVAKLRDCRQAGMAPAEAERLAVDTVRAMLDRGWGKKDEPPVQEPDAPDGAPSAEFDLCIDEYAPGQGAYDGDPPPYDWLFAGLVEQGELAVMSAPGGCGKSTMATQAVLAVATGRPWLGWYEVGGDPGEAWYLSSEDSQRTLHRRIDAAMGLMTPSDRGLARRFARLRSLPSRYTLFRQDSRSKAVAPTKAWTPFRELVLERRPRLIVIDPLSAVTRITEGDNTGMGDALDYLEELADESGAVIMYLHHTLKAQSLLQEREEIDGMDQSAIRGAGAIVNTPRVALLAYPLHVKLARQCLEDGADVTSNGQIIVLKEVKKNNGILAPARFLRHTKRMGLLEPCTNVRERALGVDGRAESRAILKAQTLDEQARQLAEAVVAREQEDREDKRRVAPSKACICLRMGDDHPKSRAISYQAQELGLVQPVQIRDLVALGLSPKSRSRGEVLVPTAEALRRHGRPDPSRPGEYLNVSAELRQWIEAGLPAYMPEDAPAEEGGTPEWAKPETAGGGAGAAADAVPDGGEEGPC